MNSNRIIELDIISNLSENLPLNDSVYTSVKCLKLDEYRFIDLRLFKSLQVLSLNLDF